MPSMWFKITHPDYLVYLQVDYPTTISRKQLDWTQAEYDEQIYRLRDAYAHANLVIDTSRLSLDATVDRITVQLRAAGIEPTPPALEKV